MYISKGWRLCRQPLHVLSSIAWDGMSVPPWCEKCFSLMYQLGACIDLFMVTQCAMRHHAMPVLAWQKNALVESQYTLDVQPSVFQHLCFHTSVAWCLASTSSFAFALFQIFTIYLVPLFGSHSPPPKVLLLISLCNSQNKTSDFSQMT